MVDIDERVVSMKFDSSDFEKKSKSTLDTLDKLNDKMTFKDAADGDVLNRIADSVDKIAHKSYNIVDMWVEKIKNNIINKFEGFLKENTIGQLQAGWSKYADMTTSVATLKAQGYSMDKITDQLERLNYFTDETSYQFTKMVGEIGKFTASGQSLEDATTAMMGIAEWAALSGKNAGEASRAMYQLSQALGAGTMRLIDYKSIQNLNMDTVEFRKNAIEAALAVGTLKDNLDGTYTSLVNNKVSFSIQNFAESLSQGKWFNSKVMMETYKKYSEAVDEIRDIYEEGSYIDAEGNYTKLNTTAEAVRLVKENNQKLVERFQKTELRGDQISDILKRWKKVERVTAKTVKEYAELNELTEEQAKIEMEQKNTDYLNYLKEYGEVFKDAEESAEVALEKWHTYVSEYGIKAFNAAQEAKTFSEAIESAKDAASTVWTTIYTTVFGNYNEAKELWTDLANALYEIFVNRLWDLNDVFDYWKTGGASALEDMLDEYNKELNMLKSKSSPVQAEVDRMKLLQKEIEKIETELDTVIYNNARTTKTELQGIIDDYEKELKQLKSNESITDFDKERIKEIEKELVKLNEGMENSIFVNGRRQMFQGIYAFGSGFKSLILNFRQGWDQVSEDNLGGKKLLAFSEKLRVSGFKFYKFMQNLGATSFYRNISQGIKHLMAPINSIKQIIKSVISQFMPAGQTVQDTLNKIASKFEKITRILVPTQTTMLRIARILRGIVSLFKIIGKAIVGVYQTFIKPVLQPILNVLHEVINSLLEIIARVGDVLFEIDKGTTPLTAMTFVGKALANTLGTVWEIIKRIINTILRALAPAIGFLINSLKDLWKWITGIFDTSDGGTILDKFDKWIEKIKAAWKSVTSFKEVFEAFKGGSGLGNFITMIGAMLDTLVHKIGVSILAIFGLDEAVANSHMTQAMNSIKTVIIGIAKVLKWIYTNVIRPIVIALFKGVASAADDLLDAFKKGDFIGILETLGKILKTSGLLQIVKILRTVALLIGSGGILKAIRNLAKAFKSLQYWLTAKYYNEIANIFIKLAVSIGIFLAVAVGLTFLPTERLHEMGMIIMHLVAAMSILLVVFVVFSRLVDLSKIGLISFALAMMSIVTLVFVFVYAANQLNHVLDNLFVNSDGTYTAESIGGGIFKIIIGLAPLILGVIGILKLFKVISVLGVPGLLADFGITVAAIAASVGLLMIGLEKLSNVMSNASIGNIIGSIVSLLVILVVLTRSIGRMFKIAGGSMTVGVNVKQGLAVAISIVAIVASVSYILVPLLEDLSNNIDKFPQYMLALIEVCGSIIAVSMAFSLMTKHTANGLVVLAAGIVFERLTKVLREHMVPMIKSMSEIGSEAWSALPSLLVLVLLVAGISFALKMLFTGIGDIIRAISTVQPKIWISMALNVAIIMGTIAGITFLFDTFEIEMKASDILMIVGSVIAILMALGLFAKIADIPNTVRQDNIRKTMTSMTIMVVAVMAGLAGIVAEVNLLYGTENYEKAQEIMRTFMLSTIAILAVMLGGLFLLMNNVSSTLGNIDLVKTQTTLKTIRSAIWGFAAIIGIFSVGGVLAGLLYDNSEQFLYNVCALALSALAVIGVFFLTFDKFCNNLMSHSKVESNEVTVVIIALVGLLALIAEISFMLMPALKELAGLTWEPILASLGGISLVIATVMGMLKVLMLNSLPGKDDLVGLIAGIAGFLVSFSVIMLFIPRLFDAFNSIRGIEFSDIVSGFALILIPLGALILLVEKFSAPGVGEMFLATCMKMAGGIAILSAAMLALAAAMAFVREVLDPGSTFISGYFAVKGLANGMKNGGKELAKTTENTLVGNTLDLYKDEVKEASPSKEFRKVGKYIDIGLAQGITKDQKTVAKASTKLAVTTNEAFCDELGIQSPSKVFYENGRFVVRGFINGVNSESNKNKQAGLDMADGFSEGMQDALEGVKEDFKGLWSDFGMDYDINEAIKGFGEDAGDLLSDSLFDNFFGGSDEVFTEGDRRSLEEALKKRDAMLNEALNSTKYTYNKWKKAEAEALASGNNRAIVDNKEYDIWEIRDHIQEEWDKANNDLLKDSNYKTWSERIAALEKKKKGAQSKLTTEMTNSLSDVANNIMNNGDLMSMFNDVGNGFGGSIFGGILEGLGIDSKGDVGAQIKGKIGGFLGQFGLTGDIGTDVQTGIDSLCAWISGESAEGGKIATAGENLSNGLFSGAKRAIENIKQDIVDSLMTYTPWGITDLVRTSNKNMVDFAYTKYFEGTKYEEFGHMLKASLSKIPDQVVITAQDIADMFEEYKNSLDDYDIFNIDYGSNIFSDKLEWSLNKRSKEVTKKVEEANNIFNGIDNAEQYKVEEAFSLPAGLFGEKNGKNYKGYIYSNELMKDKTIDELFEEGWYIVDNTISSFIDGFDDYAQLALDLEVYAQKNGTTLSDIEKMYSENSTLGAIILENQSEQQEKYANELTGVYQKELINRLGKMYDSSLQFDYLDFESAELEDLFYDTFSVLDYDNKSVVDRFMNAIGQYGDLYDFIYNYGIKDKNGKKGLKLTPKGEYLLTELLKLSKNNEHAGSADLQRIMNNYDPDAVKGIKTRLDNNIQTSLDDLLTQNGYNIRSFSPDELKEIEGAASKLGLIDYDNYQLITKDKENEQNFEILLSKINEITRNGLKVIDQDKDKKSTYDLAQEIVNQGGKTYLEKLYNEARDNKNPQASKKLNQLTGGLSYSEFIRSIEADYEWLTSFMKTTDYGRSSSAEKQEYKKQKEFYEKYFGLGESIIEGETDGIVSQANKPLTQEQVDRAQAKVLEYAEEFNDINSPSRLYEEEIGEPIGEGTILGMTKTLTSNATEKKIDNAFSNTLDTMSKVTSPVNDLLSDFDIGSGSPLDIFNYAVDDSWNKLLDEYKYIYKSVWGYAKRKDNEMYNKQDNEEDFLDSMSGGKISGVGSSLPLWFLSWYKDELDKNAPTIRTEEDILNGKNITPVYTDSSNIGNILQNIPILGKAVQATVDSFQDKSYNYTSEFDTLANGIMGTNMLLQSLCDTLEQGGIIDVNVNAETDSNNLFNFVIDKGKEEWKRTGRNRFNLGGA